MKIQQIFFRTPVRHPSAGMAPSLSASETVSIEVTECAGLRVVKISAFNEGAAARGFEEHIVYCVPVENVTWFVPAAEPVVASGSKSPKR